jgi:hypothetical protein
MIGGKADRQPSLVGFLGSPAYPSDLSATPSTIYPTAARSDLVLHSAGQDGFYLGTDDRGAKQFAGTPPTIDYERSFFAAGGKRLQTDAGQGETIDLLKSFDDLIQTGN